MYVGACFRGQRCTPPIDLFYDGGIPALRNFLGSPYEAFADTVSSTATKIQHNNSHLRRACFGNPATLPNPRRADVHGIQFCWPSLGRQPSLPTFWPRTTKFGRVTHLAGCVLNVQRRS